MVGKDLEAEQESLRLRKASLEEKRAASQEVALITEPRTRWVAAALSLLCFLCEEPQHPQEVSR